MYLPNRDELSLRHVLALPNASSTGFEWMSRSCIETTDAAPLPSTVLLLRSR